MTHVLLHIGANMPAGEDVKAVRAFAEKLGARLHVIFTQPDPLSAGWQAEVDAAGLPAVHQAMEEEARTKLRPIFGADAELPTIQIRTGDIIRGITEYADEARIDLIIVGLSQDDGELASELVEHAKCSVLLWRKR